MKTTKFLITGIMVIALAGFVLTGCKKDSTNTTTPPAASSDATAASDEANASAAMNDSKNVSDASVQNQKEYGPEHSVGVTYHCTVKWSIDTVGASSSGVDTVYLTFGNGTTPVYCNDGRYRQGTIILYAHVASGYTLRETYLTSGSVITMTFSNYAFGNSLLSMIGITGTRIWTNTGANALSQENWSFTANLTLTYFGDNNKTATWSSTRTNSLIQQGGVYYYEITGSASGTDKGGVSYNVSITSPLYVTAHPWWAGGCAFIESGVIQITASSNTLIITYGSIGTCSTTAYYSLNGGANVQFSLL